jgi:hypothetical protein
MGRLPLRAGQQSSNRAQQMQRERFATSLPETVFPQAKQAALRALEIDNQLAEAHVSLGLIKERWDWDFAGAEAEYKAGHRIGSQIC